MKDIPVFEVYDKSIDDGYFFHSDSESVELVRKIHFFCLEHKTDRFIFKNLATGEEVLVKVNMGFIKKHLKKCYQVN